MNRTTVSIREGLLSTKWVAFRYLTIKVVLMGISIAMPLLMARFVDALVSGEGSAVFLRWGYVFIGVSLVRIVLKYVSELQNTRIDATAVFVTSQSVIRHHLLTSLDELAKIESSYISSRIIADVRSVITFVLNNAVESVFGIASVIVISIILFRMNGTVFLALIGIVPVSVFLFSFFQKKMAERAAATKEVAARYSASNQKQCRSYLYLKLNGLLETSKSFVHRYFAKSLSGFLAYRKVSSLLDSSIGVAQLLGTGFTLLYGGYLVWSSRLSIGEFTAISSYFSTIVATIGSLVVAGRSSIEAVEAGKRIQQIFGREIEVVGNENPGSVDSLEVQKLSVCLDRQTWLLDGLDAQFEKGNLYCIEGRNGTGKSTLVNALLGGYTTVRGEIRYNGTRMQEIDLPKLRHDRIVYLPQQPVLFFENAEEIVSMGGKTENVEAAIENLDAVFGRSGVFDELSRKLEVTGDSIENRLSGGEKQKTALASAFAGDYDVVILDEPTSAVDEEAIPRVIELIKKSCRDRIVICVSHERRLIEAADVVISR